MSTTKDKDDATYTDDMRVRYTYARKKVKVSICIAHLAYNASNALFVTNPSRQPHSHHVQPADTG